MKGVIAVLGVVLLAVGGCLDNPQTEPSPVLIQSNQIGVLTDLETGELLDPLMPGMHLIEPGSYDLTIYTLGEIVISLSGSPEDGQGGAIVAQTQDGEAVRLDVSLAFSIDIAQINQLHTDFGPDYLSTFVDPTIRELANEVVALYSADELRGDWREEMGTALEDRTRTALAAEGLILSDLMVDDIQFPE